ncbi:MAG TPA: hypothetical protein VMT15_04050 [Bryobacteraceae bacterium]|nr:hypothetical protein [Bryobacteraceae bacterium]
MRIRVLLLVLLCAPGVFGQRRRFSWQNACFNNPGAPYCQGRDFAVKPVKPGKGGTPGGSGGSFEPSATEDVMPSVIGMSGIDWRFADPQADTLVSASFSHLSPSPLARSLMAGLGVSQGLAETDVKKILDAFSGVDQVALSVRGDQVLIMVTGSGADSALPAIEAGWKTTPVQGALLIGPSQAVDAAIQRIAADEPPSVLARSAGKRDSNGDFWVASSAAAAGPEAKAAGLKWYSLRGSMRDRLSSDTAFEFGKPPTADVVGTLPALGGSFVEGSVVHFRMSLEPAEIEPSLETLRSAPIGQYLSALMKAGRFVPARDPAKAPAKPKIVGLDNSN